MEKQPPFIVTFVCIHCGKRVPVDAKLAGISPYTLARLRKEKNYVRKDSLRGS